MYLLFVTVFVRFVFTISPLTLSLIASVLNPLKWTQDRAVVADLRREVVRWLTRCLPESASRTWLHCKHTDVVNGALNAWKGILENLNVEQTLNKIQLRALTWIIRIHLESLCIGFVWSAFPEVSSTTTSNLSEKQANRGPADAKYQIDRALCTLHALPDFCLNSVLPPLLLNILGETAADVARTVTAADAVEVLLSSIPQRDIPFENSQSYSHLFQNVLWEILHTHYDSVSGKVSQRMRANYEKERKHNENTEYLAKLEKMTRQPPLEEYQSDLLAYETKLWCQFLRWFNLPQFELTRCTTKWTPRIANLADHLRMVFILIADNMKSGLISVHILRLIVTCKEYLTYAWKALNVVDCDKTEFIDMVDLEIQNAFGDLKILMQVKCMYYVSHVYIE
jgi:hypothetical protein